MLTVAPSATEAISTLVSAQGLPDGAGVRIVAAPGEGSVGRTLQIGLAEAPAPTDQVIDEGDAHVFVDTEVAEQLDDRTLEASAQGNEVSFALSGPSA